MTRPLPTNRPRGSGRRGRDLLRDGGSWLANTSQDPTFTRAAGLALIAAGLYLLVVGGIARGTQLTRPGAPATTTSAEAAQGTSTP